VDQKIQQKPSHRAPRRKLVFLCIALLLLIGCSFAAGKAEAQIGIGLITPPNFLKIGGLRIPGEALTSPSTARTTVHSLQHFKDVSGASESKVKASFDKAVKVSKDQAKDRAKDAADVALDQIEPDLKEDETEHNLQQNKAELEKREKAARDAIARAVVDAARREFSPLEKEGMCALATQRMIQEAYAYQRFKADDSDWWQYRMLAPDNDDISAWMDKQGTSTGSKTKEGVTQNMRSFRDRLWYPPNNPPEAQPPLNPVGYAQVSYALCPSSSS
jgi:hypothetical protein